LLLALNRWPHCLFTRGAKPCCCILSQSDLVKLRLVERVVAACPLGLDLPPGLLLVIAFLQLVLYKQEVLAKLHQYEYVLELPPIIEIAL
jgi:hypothetical protein